ncbi:DUF1684 domain-containing protein [Thermomonas sp. LB-4]|uniref:DUF1684 domain-containing protein n=1 Tax=Thermomonas sp. LB-4 TaxID=3102790 RepID=UPI002EDB76B2
MVPARTLTLLAAAALAMAACSRDAAPSAAQEAAKAKAAAAFAASERTWRAQRLAELTKPDGWASLVGLHWLDRGSHRVGSAADNGVRLSMGPPHLGVFSVRDGKVRFAADAAVTVDGATSRGGRLRTDADAAGPSVIAFDDGKGLATVISRGGRLALRVKHADADSRVHFTGLQYWPGGPQWRLQARFVPHPPGRTLPIANIIGTTDEIPNPGVVEFTRNGTPYRLEALDQGEGTLFLVFADRTSGHGSYGAGRFIDAPMPDARGRLTLDFNRAYNPPCAFTPFATCPLPPPENRLDLRVEAGEKTYRKPETSNEDA